MEISCRILSTRLSILLLLVLLAACSEAEPLILPTAVPTTSLLPTHTPSPTITITHTATSSPSPSATFTATPTSTPSPTPTATAVPITLSGDPRAAILSSPMPQANAPCGLVDTLDFPIEPPDAATVSRGGEDFGIFRSRYDKYHAGEDWGGPAGQPNLGTAVHSIGHGLITYAEPEGWNRDKGVVIIQHTFADGHSFYSFYGHLDPPSITLEPGSCVTRGQQVGNIGKPRSSPHLHFEIRTHMPYTPGPGYWPEDPTTAGWLPPSATIWQERLSAAPGVQWVWPEAASGSPEAASPSATQYIGLLDAETLAVLADGQVLGLNSSNGRVRWRYSLADESRLETATLDTTHPLIYLANQFGQITAVTPPNDQFTFSKQWELNVNTTGLPTLLPLPGGGVLLLARQQVVAVSAEGVEMWRGELPARPSHWATSADLIALTTADESSGLWTVDQSGLTPWPTPGGYPTILNSNVSVYTPIGVYNLNKQTQAANWLLTLPRTFRQNDPMVALPDGRKLLIHTDLFDQRLFALNSDGTIQWQRSLGDVAADEVKLMESGGHLYLITQTNANNTNQVTVYTIDANNAHLTRLFVGGSRTALTTATWYATANGLLLVNIGGGHLIALDPLAALETVQP